MLIAMLIHPLLLVLKYFVRYLSVRRQGVNDQLGELKLVQIGVGLMSVIYT